MTVTNAGNILGGPVKYGVDLGGGGLVTNTGSIVGGEDGIRIQNANGRW